MDALIISKKSSPRIYLKILLLLKLITSLCLVVSCLMIFMTNSMLKWPYLSPRSLTWKTEYSEVAGDCTDPLTDTVNIVTDSLDTIKAEAVIRRGDVAGTLPRLLSVSNVPKLATPCDDKLRVGVAHPGVPPVHQGVGDCVRPQLVEMDHPDTMVLISSEVQMGTAGAGT